MVISMVKFGFFVAIECTQAIKLFSIENYYESRPGIGHDPRVWKDWRVVSVDPGTGAVEGLTGWQNLCGPTLHPMGGCGSHNSPVAVLYDGKWDQKPVPRTVMLTEAEGFTFDMVSSATSTNRYAHGENAMYMADMNDGFAFAAQVDELYATYNQVSVYRMDSSPPGPIYGTHIATIVLDRLDQGPPQIAIAAGCKIDMKEGCNMPSSMVYVSLTGYGSKGGLYTIANADGEITKVPVKGIEGYPEHFTVHTLWTDLDVHPQKSIVLAGMGSGGNMTMYEVDLSTGSATMVFNANIGSVRGCSAYDDANRRWYLGCGPISSVSVDTWKVTTGPSPQHDTKFYSLAGLEALLDKPRLSLLEQGSDIVI